MGVKSYWILAKIVELNVSSLKSTGMTKKTPDAVTQPAVSLGRAGLIVFSVALLIRAIHLSQMQSSPVRDLLWSDAQSYDTWARNIAAGDWIGKDVFYQAPLYPYFLGVIYKLLNGSLLAARVCQAIIGSVSCVLLAAAGCRFFSRPVGLAAGLILAFYAPAIFYDDLIQKSVLDLFFVCLLLWSLSKINSYELAILDRGLRGDSRAGKDSRERRGEKGFSHL